MSTLACYSLADGTEVAEECSKLHYFAEKDSYDTAGNNVVRAVWWFVCVDLRGSARDNAVHVDAINLWENRSFINICKEKEFLRELAGKYKI